MSFDYLLNDGDEDEILARVQEESLRFFREVELPRLNGESNNADRNSSVDKNESVADIPGNPGTSGIISIDKLDKTPDSTVLCTQVGGRAGTLLFEGDEAKGFHLAAGSSYIYPTNYPIRQYQAAIVRSALFQNTLVSLPTGLGKTFIAAVVMYNFYRWYPRGKVVFMAPTRPLVAQQIKACYSIMGIPPEDTTEMTGIQVADVREKLWNEKRVFFLTPQVMVNDLRSNICPAASVKCIVVDEAHKAVKDYAYCQVIKLLSAANTVYRTLALSATPGNDINAVIQVIRNLNISCLEMRGEDSIDVSPYTHGKSIEHVVVDLSPEVLRVKDDFLQVYERFARSLIENRGITSNIAFLTKFQILKSMEKFRANPPRGMSSTMIGSLVSDFTMCMTLAHALELLQIYGLRAFYRYLADEDGEKSKAAVTRLRNNEDLQRMLRLLHGLLYPKHNAEVPYVWGHPKLKKLVNSLSEHFKSAEDKGEQTKAIVFCNYKVVVNEIVDLLSKCKPLVRATLFVGQSGGKERGMPQAKQLQIMKEFRDGKINCLVATCVAEEGLDIGEVDLIVLMESQKSPVRLVQRLGRTGRKRRGRCIVLLTRGKEESKFHEAMASRKSYVRNIVESKAVKNSLCQYSPPMFPPGTKPQQQLVHIKVVTTPTPTKPAKTGKKQMDIRDCAVTESRPFLDVDAEKQVLEELRGTSLDFKTLPDRMELWYRKSDPPMSVDELLNGKANILSSWNDWNMELQNSFVMSSTTASETLCHLLSYSVTNENENYLKLVENFEKYGELAFEHPKNDQPSKKNAEVADDEKKSKKKNLPKKNYGMDIRSCMATAVEKASKRPKVDLDVSDDDVIIVEPKCNEDIEARIESEKLELNEPPRETGSGLDIAGIFGMNVDEFENVLYGGELLCGLEQNIGMCLRLSKFAGKSACVAPKPKLVDPGVFEFQCDQLLKLMDTVDEIKLEPGYFLKHGTELPEAVITQEVVVESKPVNDSFVDIDDLLGDDVNEVEANCAYGSSNEEKSIKAIPVEEGNIGVISPTEKKSENLSSVWSSHSFFVELSPIGKATKPNSNIISSTPISARVTSKNTDQEIGVADKEDQWLLDDILELDEEVTTNVKKCETLNSSRDLFASTPGAPKSHQKTTVEMKSVNQMNVFKEPRVLQGERKSDEVEEDVWCLDDLFEEGKLHDVTCSGRDAKNETSFYGITQMVSQIERDKIKMIGNACETVEIIDSPVQSPLKNINNSCMPLRSKIVESDCFPVDGEIQKIDSAIPTSRDLPLSQDILSNRVKKPLVQDSVQKDDCIIVIDSDSCGSHSSEPKVQEVLPPVSASQFEKSSIDKEKGAQADRSLLDEDDDVFSVLAAGDFLEKELPEKGRKDNIVQVNVKKFKTKSLFSSLDKQPDNDFAPNQRNSFLEDNSHLKVGGSSKRKLSFEDLLDELDGGTTSKYFARGNPIKAQLNPSIEPSTSTKATKEQTPSLCGSRMETAESSVTKLAKDEDDEDVFIRPRRDGGLIAPFTRSDKSASSSSSPSPLKRVKVKKKSKKKGNVFIEVEAEESGILSADDSDNSSLDEMDDSFVDDESDQEQSYAHYLKSVKSPVVGGKFKIPMNKRYMGNVYSQVVNHEDDNYENDSFCVDSDEEHSGDETTVLERVEKELAKKKKKKKTIKEGPRKRIIKPTDESDCEDVVVNLEDTVAVSGVPKTFKKRFLDSDSDVTPERPALKRPRHRIVSPVENEKCSTAQDQSPPAKREFPAPPGSAKSPIHVDSGSDEELKEAIRLSKLESAKKKTDEERFEEDLQKALLLSQCDVPGPSTMADVPGPSSEAVLPTFTSPGDRGTSLLFMSQPILRDKRPFSTKSKPKSKPEASTNCKRIFELSDSD